MLMVNVKTTARNAMQTVLLKVYAIPIITCYLNRIGGADIIREENQRSSRVVEINAITLIYICRTGGSGGQQLGGYCLLPLTNTNMRHRGHGVVHGSPARYVVRFVWSFLALL